jgi:hypothetical protein
MSQQTYWWKQDGDYHLAHNGGENYYINNFKNNLLSLAKYLARLSVNKTPVKVDPELPPHYEPNGAKIEFPTYWEVHQLRDMMDAPEAFENLEDRAAMRGNGQSAQSA